MCMSKRSRLVIVANRIPDTATSVGGLVSALAPAVAARPGEVVWFGWSGKNTRGSRPRVERRRSRGQESFAISFSEKLADGYYTNFCNGGLWPLLHSFPGRFSVEGEDYRAYRRVNEIFARTMIRHLREEDLVWVHDFHLIPLAHELRRLGFAGRIGFFLHVPFPPPEIFALMPWATELLEDVTAFDLVGVHTPEYARNLRRTLGRQSFRPRTVPTRVYPIGIDPRPYEEWSQEPAALKIGQRLRHSLLGRKLVLGVDRLDYTKGITERLRIYGRLLELYPRWKKRVSFIQISAPSRTRVAEYVKQRREVEELVGHLNGRHGHTEWVPVRYLFQSYSQRDLAAFYREADVALVTPLRDGMNLVAKEFVAAQTGDPGVLVLSQFAGAASELSDAVLVNPYDIDASAHALHAALSMPVEERIERQRALLARVHSQTAAAWAEGFLADLEDGDSLSSHSHARMGHLSHTIEPDVAEASEQ